MKGWQQWVSVTCYCQAFSLMIICSYCVKTLLTSSSDPKKIYLLQWPIFTVVYNLVKDFERHMLYLACELIPWAHNAFCVAGACYLYRDKFRKFLVFIFEIIPYYFFYHRNACKHNIINLIATVTLANYKQRIIFFFSSLISFISYILNFNQFIINNFFIHDLVNSKQFFFHSQ